MNRKKLLLGGSLFFTMLLTACGGEGTSSVNPGTCDHDYGSYVVTKEPTCTGVGYEEKTCKLCGHVESQTLDPLGHIKTDEYGYNEHYHYFKCGRCGDDAELDKQYHAEENLLTVETLEGGLEYEYTCVCGYSYRRKTVQDIYLKEDPALEGRFDFTLMVGDTRTLEFGYGPEDAPNNFVAITQSIDDTVKIFDSTFDKETLTLTIEALRPGTGSVRVASNFSSAELKVYVTVIPKETIVTHIEKEVEQVELKVGENYTLQPILTPGNANNGNLTFESEDESICEVHTDGRIDGVGVGETNVKVTSKMEPSVYVTYKVIVTEPQIVFTKDVIYFDVNDLSNANLNDYLYNTLNKPIRWAEPIPFLYQAVIPYVFNSSVKEPSSPLSLSPRRPWPI